MFRPGIFDSSGNIYGTTETGGVLSGCVAPLNGVAAAGCGLVYELSPRPSGEWALTLLHTFQPGMSGKGGTGGAGPVPGLAFDTSGNLYGTAASGGRTTSPFGVLFKLGPSSGAWTETVLHSFFGSTDGGTPYSGLTLSSGNFYGTASVGGILSDCSPSSGCGVVFEITP